jgi:4-amino-4-deoxy-L-arabinose transferase-like glycosyltransferase
MRQSRERHLLFIGIIVAVLPMMLLRDFTPSNELRYLSIADEALRNNTFFAFSCHGVPYADKPPLYLWIVMACRWLTGGHHMWLLSLFSFVPALCIVKVMDGWTRGDMDAVSHELGLLMTLTSGLFLVSALTIRMDMLMSLFIVLALRESWRMYSVGVDAVIPIRQRLLFPLFVFLAVFTKGPLGFLIPLLCSAVFIFFFSAKPREERLKLFCRIWGWRTWLVLLLLCALWFTAVYEEGGPEYLHNLLFHQTIGRAVHSFHHSHPFYYYAIVIWYCLAPWSPLVIVVLGMSLRRSVVKSDLQRFFLTISVVTFILLSCLSGKLEIYLLPALPFMVYASAMFIPRFVKSVSRLYRITRGIAICLLFVVFAGGCAMPWLNAYIGYDRLCDEAKEVSAEYGITEYRTWHLKHSENMDAYLHRAVMKIPDDTVPVRSADRPFIMLTKRKYLDHFKGLRTQIVGDNAVVVCPVCRY